MAKTDKIKSNKSRGGYSKRGLLARIFGVLTLCAVLVTGVVFALPNNNNNAEAQNTANNTPTVGEIWNGTGVNSANIKTLFKQLTNKETASMSDVKAAAATPKGGTTFYSYAAGGKAANKDIVVQFAGLKWTAVYLSTVDQATGNNHNGDVVLTLWLTAGTTQHTYSGDATGACWIGGNGSYPASMYSTSYLRSKCLNIGSDYAINTEALYSSTGSTVTQDPGHIFAKFTMDSVAGNVTKYLVSPENLHWQEDQQNRVIKGSDASAYDHNVNLSNEAYSTSIPNMAAANWQGKEHYSDWKSDLIWEPSASEVGHSTAAVGRGLWQTTLTQRQDDSPKISWLRSAYQVLTSTGTNIGVRYDGNYGGASEVNNSNYYIRPALHLNLSRLCIELPEDEEVEYNGEDFSILSNFEAANFGWYNPTYMTVSSTASAIDVGTYTFTASLNATALAEGIKWMDNSTTDKTFKLTIKKKKIGMYAPSVTDEGDLLTGYEYQIFTPGVPYEHDIDRTGATPVYKDTAPEFALEYRKDG
ncbi:MAG: hypothetical protein K2N74_06185, partial [Clostridiales bacterium]|nr:hypothetical protein [Clostridiales bacterium]